MISKQYSLLLSFMLLPFGASAQRVQKYAVNDSKYLNNMTVTCIVKDGNQNLKDYEIAVFDKNGELRGAVLANAQGYGYLMVYGDTKTEELKVKVITGSGTDVSKYVEHPVYESLTFESDKNLGTKLAPFELTLPIMGDVNYDKKISVGDIAHLVDILQGNRVDMYGTADADGNGSVNKADVSKLSDMILQK